MQKSVIDYLFENDSCFDHKADSKSIDEFHKQYEKLQKMLSEKQFAAVNEFIDYIVALDSETEELYFKDGMKMGVRLVVECLTE